MNCIPCIMLSRIPSGIILVIYLCNLRSVIKQNDCDLSVCKLKNWKWKNSKTLNDSSNRFCC